MPPGKFSGVASDKLLLILQEPYVRDHHLEARILIGRIAFAGCNKALMFGDRLNMLVASFYSAPNFFVQHIDYGHKTFSSLGPLKLAASRPSDGRSGLTPSGHEGVSGELSPCDPAPLPFDAGIGARAQG